MWRSASRQPPGWSSPGLTSARRYPCNISYSSWSWPFWRICATAPRTLSICPCRMHSGRRGASAASSCGCAAHCWRWSSRAIGLRMRSIPTSAPPNPSMLLVIVGLALLASGIAPYDRTTWWLEIFPLLIGAPLLLLTASRFPLTPLTYTLLAVHALILIVGGHYTYARVPLGFWVQDLLGLARNDYDRLGHFAQGFVPAILVREILLRTSPLRPGRWLFVLVTAMCLAFSACYEFFEWWSALVGGHSADAFLGTQGDVWDTQWDMFSALVGALVAQVTLARIHDRSLAKLLRP